MRVTCYRNHRLVLAILLVPLFATVLPADVKAQSGAAAAPEDPALNAAKAAFEEAQTLYIKENWDGAAAKFIAAFEAKPFAAFLFNAGAAYEKANRVELAIDYYQRYIAKDPNAKDARDVVLRIDGLKRNLALKSGTPPAPGQPDQPVSMAMLPAIETKGLVIIDSKPADATIYLNDKANGPLGNTRWEGSLAPHPVTIILEARGFKPEKRKINPRPDKILEIYIALSEEHFLGWVEIASNVAGAEIFLDRKEIGSIGKTPFTGHVKPGKHKIWIEKAGYETLEKDIEVLPGTAASHQFDLNRVSVGWVAVRGKNSKGAKLLVDGKFACDTPCQHAVPTGTHAVRVTKEGMEDFQSTVKVEQAIQTTVDLVFSPKPPKTRAWTTAVISAIFLGGGIYMGLEANNLEDALRKESNATPLPVGAPLVDSGDDRVLKGKIYAIGADVAFGLAAITGVVSLVNFLSSGPASTGEMDEKTIGFAPVPMSDGGGFAASGRF